LTDYGDNSFANLSSINFSDLSSVGMNWMNGNNFGFSRMESIYVGDVAFKTNFSMFAFCNNFPSGESIYANSYEIASSWQKGGMSSWNADINDSICSFYTLASGSF